MHPLYKPTINLGVRTLFKPFARLMPDAWQFPVTGVITVKLGGRRRIRLACNPTSYLAKVLFWQGVEGFEYNLVRVFVELVKEARVFLDVGANIGYYSLLAAAYNPDVKIVSFEPLPSAFHYLEKNLALNGCANATAVKAALSDATGAAQFFASKNPKFLDIDYPLTSTGALDEAQAARSAVVEAFDVQTETLDNYVASMGETVDLLKLDTEASEHIVLAGAQDVLKTHRPVILCEVLPGKIERDLEAIFKDHGYRMYRAETHRLVPVDRLAHSAATTNDHVMVHPDTGHTMDRFLTT